MKKVLIVGGNGQYNRMFNTLGYTTQNAVAIHPSLGDADLVCFCGGADVNPALYGHTVHSTTYYSINDDDLYLNYYKLAKKAGIKMVGICRGSQFLCAMAGGTLIQDVKGHATGSLHPVKTIFGEGYMVTSTHHQMQYPVGVPHEVWAAADIGQSHKQHIDDDEVEVVVPMDYEVVYYPEIKALGFQPHPEFAEGSCRDLFVKCLEKMEA